MAWALAHPDAGAQLRKLNKAEFDSNDWRVALCMLSRLGGRAVAQPGKESGEGHDRVERASGGAVGAQKLIRSAEVARKQIATATKPLASMPDEAIANALRLAAMK